MRDILGIDVCLFFWQTQLLSTAKALENMKRRYKQMYINFALRRQDNEGGTTPRNTVDQSTHYNCIYTNWRLVDYYTMILHDSSSGLKMNIDRDMISRILKSRYILSIVPG